MLQIMKREWKKCTARSRSVAALAATVALAAVAAAVAATLAVSRWADGDDGMEMEMAGSGSSCNYDALLVAYRQHVGRGKQSKPSLWQGPGQEHQ